MSERMFTLGPDHFLSDVPIILFHSRTVYMCIANALL